MGNRFSTLPYAGQLYIDQRMRRRAAKVCYQLPTPTTGLSRHNYYKKAILTASKLGYFTCSWTGDKLGKNTCEELGKLGYFYTQTADLDTWIITISWDMAMYRTDSSSDSVGCSSSTDSEDDEYFGDLSY